MVSIIVSYTLACAIRGRKDCSTIFSSSRFSNALQERMVRHHTPYHALCHRSLNKGVVSAAMVFIWQRVRRHSEDGINRTISNQRRCVLVQTKYGALLVARALCPDHHNNDVKICRKHGCLIAWQCRNQPGCLDDAPHGKADG